jgi:hypothetical protein
MSPKVTGHRTLGSALEEAMPKTSMATAQRNRFYAESRSGAFSPVAASSLAMSVKERKSLLVGNYREGQVAATDYQWPNGSGARGASHRTGKLGRSWRNQNRSGSFLNHWPRDETLSLNASTTAQNQNLFANQHKVLASMARSELA